MSSSSLSLKNAVRRLLADLSEWQRHSHEYPCIDALPLDGNLFEWHCNLAPNGGRFEGMIIHIKLSFPATYPLHPPEVSVCSKMDHPNVYGSWICLDMIRKYEQGAYKGWTAAYSVSSLLMQLQSFLFEESGVDQDYGSSKRNKWTRQTMRYMLGRAKAFKCVKCGHTWEKPFPPIRSDFVEMKSDENEENEGCQKKEIDFVISSSNVFGSNGLRVTKIQMNKENENDNGGDGDNDGNDGSNKMKEGETTKSNVEKEVRQKYFDLRENEKMKAKYENQAFGYNNKRLNNKQKKRRQKQANIDLFCDNSYSKNNGQNKNGKKKNNKIDTNTGKGKVLSMKEYNQRLKKQQAMRGKLCGIDIDNNNGKKKKNKKSKNKDENESDSTTQGNTGTTKGGQTATPTQATQAQATQAQETKADQLNIEESKMASSSNSSVSARNESKNEKETRKIGKNKAKKFCLWDGIYYDLESAILSFFDIRDLLKLMRVSKKFQTMVELSNKFQRHGIQCWFHRAYKVPANLNDAQAIAKGQIRNGAMDTNYGREMKQLCLGYGITPRYFRTNGGLQQQSTTMYYQIYGGELCNQIPGYLDNIRSKIGDYPMLSSVDTTFDLLSSDAFENFEIRKTVFNDTQFTHFMPLFISRTHGQTSLNRIPYYVCKVFDEAYPMENDESSKFGNSFNDSNVGENEDEFEAFGVDVWELVQLSKLPDSVVSFADYQKKQYSESRFTSNEQNENNKTKEERNKHMQEALKAVRLGQNEEEKEAASKDETKNGDNNNENNCKKEKILEMEYYHPFLTIYTIANTMKSLIVSVMQDCKKGNGNISLHYSINILDAFFRYHHLLLSIYFNNVNELKPIIQDQINLFFRNVILLNGQNRRSRNSRFQPKNIKEYRSKSYVPDFGVFLMYLTLWQRNDSLSWERIGNELLDETFTRQVKWVLNSHPQMIRYYNNNNSGWNKERIENTWNETLVSRRLIMFQFFFLKQVCKLFGGGGGKGKGKNGSKLRSPKLKFEEYNENFGSSKDKSLPVKLQNYVKKIYNVNNYQEFFERIELPYPGENGLSQWLLNCMYQSRDRMYHKPYIYFSKLKKIESAMMRKPQES